MADTKSRILLTENDINLATVLGDYLRQQGYIAKRESAGEIEQAILEGKYDLVVLSTNSEEVRWAELLRHVRQAACTVPVILLADSQAREDIIEAFHMGADDYVTKPFSIEILVCRIEAILRRLRQQEAGSKKVYDMAGRTFDSVRQTYDGQHLSARESDLLLLLCRHEGTVIDRHQILRTLWKTDDKFSARSLCVYINHLRKILAGTPYRIIGVHGKGYKLVCD